MWPLISKYLAPSSSLSKFDFAWFLLLTLSIWPHFFCLFVFHSLSVPWLLHLTCPDENSILHLNPQLPSSTMAPVPDARWRIKLTSPAHRSGGVTQPGGLTPRVVLKWLEVLSSLQGISNLSNILFHKLQCRQIFEQNFKKYFFLNNLLPWYIYSI